MLTRYVDLIGMNSDLDSALQIATWTALSKDNYGTVNFMLQYSFQGYLSLLTHTTENLPIDVSTSLVVMSSVETGREEISSSQISSSEPPVMHTVTETTPVPASDKLFQDAFQLYRFGHKRIDVTLRVEFERVLIILYQKTLLGQEQPLSAAGQCNIHALVKLCLKQPWASSKKGKSKLSVASTAQRHVSSDKKDSTNEVEASQCTLVLSQSQSQFEGASDLAMSEDYEEIVPMYFESVEYI